MKPHSETPSPHEGESPVPDGIKCPMCRDAGVVWARAGALPMGFKRFAGAAIIHSEDRQHVQITCPSCGDAPAPTPPDEGRVREIARMICTHDPSDDCVQVSDPEREPCSDQNCNYMPLARAIAALPAAPAGEVVAEEIEGLQARVYSLTGDLINCAEKLGRAERNAIEKALRSPVQFPDADKEGSFHSGFGAGVAAFSDAIRKTVPCPSDKEGGAR